MNQEQQLEDRIKKLEEEVADMKDTLKLLIACYLEDKGYPPKEDQND